MVEKLAEKSPLIMRMGLQAFYATQDLPFEPALRHLEGQLDAVLATEDAIEGLDRFFAQALAGVERALRVLADRYESSHPVGGVPLSPTAQPRRPAPHHRCAPRRRSERR